MSIKCQQIIQFIEELAPRKLAESWDNVGLMIGSPNMEVNKVLVCLDVNDAVLKEAIENQVDLIVSHHPFLFSPLKNVRWDNYKGRLIKELITREIGVYSAHTNLDISHKGLNYWLANHLEIRNLEVLDKINYENLYKLAIFVPKSGIGQIKEELGRQGAGWIGNYSHCSFSTEGVGNFKPLENTNPYIGTPGKIEEVDEVRIETIVKEGDLERTLKAVLKVHPYEEVAYDIYPLKNNGRVQGLGVVGKLDKEMNTNEFIDFVKNKLNLNNLRGSGPMPNIVRKIAVCSGAGANYMHKAKFSGADVFITGDLKYHDGQTAEEIGLFVIDAGHFSTEIIVIRYLSEYLEECAKKSKANIEIMQSTSGRDTLKVY
ncbi:dinuclear metal center YbgI/SA1388 family protein [Alkalibaculum bacchi]|uniref:GTP cyclohydrolase 1 type 2 homolog n=1 Tax=Alkalibaculum bacchi TaxID=645887 RepID=A0A366IF32_9FIRM|nr:Nif3-like dinuclear metal center hexameric protein [Alkalibaculum bacchi]RBP68891.1 dinuclear metal center YbgI/SA1388 family protein [Alkalibaculum bacchi]